MSLHEKSVLVDLSLGKVTTSRIDRTVTADVLSANSAKKNAGRWVNKLWSDEALQAITTHDSATNSTHRDMTLPWLDKKRILPTARFDEYMAIMRLRKPERQALVDSFIQNYDHWLAEARIARTGLFNPAEYPSRHRAAARFTFTLSAEPVPHRDDFRIALSAPDMEEMQASLDSRLSGAADTARNELLERIVKPLVIIVERLSDPDAKFRDSLIGNLVEIAEAIPDFNITDDPGIEAVRQRITNGLGKIQPESLRSSRSDRSRAASEANNILAAIAPWMSEDAA